jgi:transcriptional regulator with XRE-family HTH domain
LSDNLQLSLDDLMNRNPNPSSFEKKNPPLDEALLRSNLIALRHSKGFSQGEEGKRIGVSRRTIIHYENGSSIPSLDALEALLALYDISCSALFYEPLAPESTVLLSEKKSKVRLLSIFLLGFFLGGGLLSAILVPALLPRSQSSSSSGTYHLQSDSHEDSTTSSSGNTVLGLSKLTIIETNGKAMDGNVVVGHSLTFTLYSEPSINFTSTINSNYSLDWSYIDYGEI